MLGTQLPDSLILPSPLPTVSSALATAGRPGQVGAKMPARSGYLVVSATVASNAFCSLS